MDRAPYLLPFKSDQQGKFQMNPASSAPPLCHASPLVCSARGPLPAFAIIGTQLRATTRSIHISFHISRRYRVQSSTLDEKRPGRHDRGVALFQEDLFPSAWRVEPGAREPSCDRTGTPGQESVPALCRLCRTWFCRPGCGWPWFGRPGARGGTRRTGLGAAGRLAQSEA